jgi:hypothetical protein
MYGQVRRLTVGLVVGVAVLSIYACSFEKADGAAGSTEAADSSGIPLPPVTRNGSVLQHHGNGSRDGFYVDPAFTSLSAGTLHRDTTFAGVVTGSVYAQPLYVENGPQNQEAFVVATEQNHVTVLDATGATIWDKQYGPPAASNLPCGNISPLGITGTPVIDEASRTVYFDTMTTPDGNRTFKHLIYAVSLDDGSVKQGWPVDFATATHNAPASYHNQRGALQLVNGTLYVPYGGHYGDCGPYHGTVVAVPVDHPTQASSWAVAGNEGGIWSTGGLATDGTNVFATTGNTSNASGWAGGEAIIRLKAGGTFSNQPADYFAPDDWKDLDESDADLGGASPVLVDMPGAPVPHLVLAFGKDAQLYIANRDNLGGIGAQLSSLKVATGAILGAGASYKTSQGTYVAFRAAYGHGVGCPTGTGTGNIGVVKILPENPPRAVMAWCTNEKLGAPIATATGPGGSAVLWDANDHLFGYDGDTGQKIFAGGGASDGMGASMQYFNTPIVANGKIAVAVPGKLVIFKP